MTPARRAVLAILEAAETPLSASGVMERLGGACDQATVYRALGRLESDSLAESFTFRCQVRGAERYYVAATRPHRHWFHCEACHRFIDAGACSLKGLIAKLAREAGLEVRSHALSFSGICPDCRRGRPSG